MRKKTYHNFTIFKVHTSIEKLKLLFEDMTQQKKEMGDKWTLEIHNKVQTFSFLISCLQNNQTVVMFFTHYIHSFYPGYDKNYINIHKMANPDYPYEWTWHTNFDIGLILEHCKWMSYDDLKKIKHHIPKHLKNISYICNIKNVKSTISELTYKKTTIKELENLK